MLDPANDTFSYRLAVRSFSATSTCAEIPLPSGSAYTGPVFSGSIEGEASAECFVFTRPPGELDSYYRIRATNAAGALVPVAFLVGNDGQARCAGGEVTCLLNAPDQYVVMVTDNLNWRTGEFRFSIRRDTNPVGCSALPGVGFDEPSSVGEIAVAGEVDCHIIPDAQQNQLFAPRFAGTSGANRDPRWTIVDGNGNTVCNSTDPNPGTCRLTGQPGWRVMVKDFASATFTYRLAMKRITNAEGCQVADFAFDAPRNVTDASDPTAANCITFSRGLDEPAARYWIRSSKVQGTLTPSWALYNEQGTRVCFSQTMGFDDELPAQYFWRLHRCRARLDDWSHR